MAKTNKDAYWFRHDSTAGRGLRMRQMAHIYGHWGKGVYWDVIEILRDQSDYKFNCDESSLQLLADLIGVKDNIKFISWYRDCVRITLFIENDGVFYSQILCENMAVWEAHKENGIKGGRPKKNQTHNPIETKPITQSKPNTKADQNHNITEHNITEHNKYGSKILISLNNWFSEFAANQTIRINALKAIGLGTNYGRLEELADMFLSTLSVSDPEGLEKKPMGEWSSYFVNWAKKQPNNNQPVFLQGTF